MADKFPGPYRNTVAQNVDAPDSMIKRVRFSDMEVGARKSVLPTNIKNGMTISHTPNANSK